jgi:hypothetical protein
MGGRLVVLDEIFGGHVLVAGLAGVLAYVLRGVGDALVFRTLVRSFRLVSELGPPRNKGGER